MTTLELTRYFSYSAMLLSSAILFYFMAVYVRFVVAETYRHGWWLLGVGTGAGLIYGLSGLFYEYTRLVEFEYFRDGASLFFILFMALGIRAVSKLGERDRIDLDRPPVGYYGLDAGIIALFVIAWWTSFAYGYQGWLAVVQAIGWLGMLGFALYFGIRAVTVHEGTSIAAVIRHLLPAIICFGAIVMVDMVTLTTRLNRHFSDAGWIVGIVLVSAFLFNTAVTIRQQEAELHRIYDRTTW